MSALPTLRPATARQGVARASVVTALATPLLIVWPRLCYGGVGSADATFAACFRSGRQYYRPLRSHLVIFFFLLFFCTV